MNEFEIFVNTIANTAIKSLDTAAEIWRTMENGFEAQAGWLVFVLVLAAVCMVAVSLGTREV